MLPGLDGFLSQHSEGTVNVLANIDGCSSEDTEDTEDTETARKTDAEIGAKLKKLC
jgi:hypothetical protein